ncbi:hypothetical protein [Erythrobacter sp. HL-111]|uniref:hypothetical protein n=1 Tax=Erythrobacter sp. HL-111 TaxID=1798193 RepID=UPI0006DB02BA|nr:hypothetical protein [Erythrobacter sp. HL-111]KPP95018.1 MAG: hypothetical protein HLUCCO15_02945 [Erythrobacteraceae bacterium HL-111]SDS11508.1 hypothetical protein SAMN04515621_0983 [Erythrobacter sp. HL-111]
MPSLLAYAAPLALLLPALGQGLVAPAGEAASGPVGLSAAGTDHAEGEERSPRALPPRPLPGAAPLTAFHQGQRVRQVRIEQRVVIRIAPQPPAARQELLAALPQRGVKTRFEEREMAKCLPVERIAGVQTGSGNRLLLFLTDERIVSVNLEKTCRARDFYSGFYVERNEDGQLCVERDRIKSRTGLRCEVERMRQLVAVKE